MHAVKDKRSVYVGAILEHNFKSYSATDTEA